MQGFHPAAKAKRRSSRISRDDEVPAAQPPAGPIDNEVPLVASALDASDAASDLASETPATVATTAADDAAPLAASAPAASPQLSVQTSPQSSQSPSMFRHADAVQDTVQSPELSGMLAIMQLSQTLSSHLAMTAWSDKTDVPVLVTCLQYCRK